MPFSRSDSTTSSGPRPRRRLPATLVVAAAAVAVLTVLVARYDRMTPQRDRADGDLGDDVVVVRPIEGREWALPGRAVPCGGVPPADRLARLVEPVPAAALLICLDDDQGARREIVLDGPQHSEAIGALVMSWSRPDGRRPLWQLTWGCDAIGWGVPAVVLRTNDGRTLALAAPLDACGKPPADAAFILQTLVDRSSQEPT